MRQISRLAAVTFGAAVAGLAPEAIMAATPWTGIYIGAHVGGARQSAPDWTYFNPNNGALFTLAQGGELGVVGGLHGGYNWQLTPAWLIGVEGDMSWTSLSQTRSVPTVGPGSFATMSATEDWLTSVRGRVGFIHASNTLFYVTGGAAWVNTEFNGHMTRIIAATTFVADAASTAPRTGWVLGGGAERMIDAHLIARLEYLYYSLDSNVTLSETIIPGTFVPVTWTWSSYSVQILRAGLTYKF